MAGDMMGKGDYLYAVPFFGNKRKMLANLVFEPDEELKHQKYMVVSRVAKGPVVAVTKGVKKDGGEWTLWSKAMPIYDMQGNFIAVVGIVRDVTGTFGDIMIDNAPDAAEKMSGPVLPQTSKPAGLFGKIFSTTTGKAIPLLQRGSMPFTGMKKDMPKRSQLSIKLLR